MHVTALVLLAYAKKAVNAIKVAGANADRLRHATPPVWLVALVALLAVTVPFLIGVSLGNG